MATRTTTLRLRPKLRARIERIAKRARRSFSEIAQDLLEEALRLRDCPGIYFADEPAGREAKVQGTGLGVWEVMRDYKAVRGNPEELREILTHVGPVELKAALLYYERYAEEIDAAIEDNARAFEEGAARSSLVVRA
jgi:hypothetical protein